VDLLSNKLKINRDYHVLGMMSGTSMDGLDLALCCFRYDKSAWKYKVLKAQTLSYDAFWLQRLSQAASLSAIKFQQLDHEYGAWLGSQVGAFLKDMPVMVDLIASHGHTIFHEPAKGITCQIGDGAAIAARTKLPVVSDFRSLDVALGGQGAPLVPLADRLLFGEYDACLNLGGFSNVSMERGRKRLAWDCCPVNVVLNSLAQDCGYQYDAEGRLGMSGKPVPDLLEQLEQLNYYTTLAPKSLGVEWVYEHVTPLINACKGKARTVDILATWYHHAASRLASDLNQEACENVLVTGGGAKNTYLLSEIANRFRGELIVPGTELVDFKEALAFALLGLLRFYRLPNCLASVTGAEQDCSSGVVHHI
jgi:anhydro-N-acetylmuramic acid kinase